jgi:GNAT superfamily N-acetyltransferase
VTTDLNEFFHLACDRDSFYHNDVRELWVPDSAYVFPDQMEAFFVSLCGSLGSPLTLSSAYSVIGAWRVVMDCRYEVIYAEGETLAAAAYAGSVYAGRLEGFRGLSRAFSEEYGSDGPPALDDAVWFGMFDRWSEEFGRLVGFARVWDGSYVRDDPAAITSVFVAKQHRRLGIAMELLKKVRLVANVTKLRGPFSESGLALKNSWDRYIGENTEEPDRVPQ